MGFAHQISLCLIVCAFFMRIDSRSVPDNVEGYYWRDYNGVIPPDAFPGGKTRDGEITYIGQTVHRSAILVPGKILASKNEMRYEFGRVEYKADDDVKILCTVHPEQLVWVKTNSKDIVGGLKDQHAIIGGHEIGSEVLIGRVFKDGEMHLGKVHTIANEFAGIHITDNGNGWQERDFEVLTYDPTVRVPQPEVPPAEISRPNQKSPLLQSPSGAGFVAGGYHSVGIVLLCLLHNFVVRRVL